MPKNMIKTSVPHITHQLSYPVLVIVESITAIYLLSFILSCWDFPVTWPSCLYNIYSYITNMSTFCYTRFTVWVKKNPPLRGADISHFPHKRLRIFNRFFTHLLYVPIIARLQIFIQLSPTLTKLCHIKLDYLVHIICAKCPKRARSDVCVSRW